MRALSFGVLCLAFAGCAVGHAGDAAPNVPRMRRHAQRLSEACRRRGRSLEDGCLTDPETTEGPYVWDTAPIRKDVTEGWEGIPYEMRITIVNSTTCEAISGAAIEIWHCTPGGIYSHFIEASVGNGTDTDDRTFLRGVQYTDSDGLVTFTSVWPGWYSGRATHVHIRVHFDITADSDNSGYTGGTVGHVGQMFFNDSVVDELATVYPYSENTITHTYLSEDIHYQAQGGTYGLMSLSEMYEGEGLSSGVIGTVTVGVDTTEAEAFDDSVLSSSSSSSSGGGDMGGEMGGGDMGNMTEGGAMGGEGERPAMPTAAPDTAAPVAATLAPTVAPDTGAPATGSPPAAMTPPSPPSTPRTPTAQATPGAPQQPAAQSPPTPPSTQQQQQQQQNHEQGQQSSPSSPSAPCSSEQSQTQSQPSTPQGFRGMQ